jgi:type IV secretory pathway VirB9-like protein
MKTILKTAVISISLVLTLCGDFTSEGPLGFSLFADAHAFIVAREARRTAVVTTVAVTSAEEKKQATASQQQAAAAQQQQAAAAQQQQAAAAQQQAAAAAAAPAPAAAQLPLGTVVPALPPGCVKTPVGGVEYFYCGGNFYRAAFQGNNLVYVTTKP